MTKLRQALEKNFLKDYRSYPATLFVEGNYKEAPVWIGVIVNNDVVLDVKWHCVGLDDESEALLISLSQDLIGLTMSQVKEALADFSTEPIIVEFLGKLNELV
ncbi:hypothetical protein DID80_04730 [Candidatus Marinamargulisbacteria bacterium SCGC AAA071-K20]|nr:hypothetical protein DID80_04730 [Candidatus Marinamargulisbacteria bacterium SCGC AAA071-K20]